MAEKAQYASFNARAETINSQPIFRIPFPEAPLPDTGTWMVRVTGQKGDQQQAVRRS